MQDYENLLWYLAVVNLATIITYGWDKFCAKRHMWRVSEKNLLALALIGGSPGALLSMRLFRHKTLHLKFKYGVPLILLLQLVALYLFASPAFCHQFHDI